MITVYTLLALYTLAGLLIYPIMHYLMRADLVDDVLDIAVGWREHAVLLGFTLVLWPLFSAMLTTGFIWQKRKIKYRNSPEGRAEIKRQKAERKRQQELNIEDALAPWNDYSDYLREPLTPRETAEIMSDDNMEYWHFRKRMQPGDILYHFSTSAQSWGGIVIMRQGNPVAHRIPVFIK